MSNYNSLRATIDANVKTNGNQEITGGILNSVLNAMVSSLGADYQFAGVATPGGTPSANDQNVAYLATEAGTYTDYGGITLDDGEVAVLLYNGSWTKTTVGISSSEVTDRLSEELLGISVTREYAVTAGEALNTTTREIRLPIRIEAGTPFTALVSYPAGSPGVQVVLYFYDSYDSDQYDARYVTVGEETELVLDNDSSGGVGLYLREADAVNGTISINVTTSTGIKGQVEVNTSDIEQLTGDVSQLFDDVVGVSSSRSYPIVAGEGINTTNKVNRVPCNIVADSPFIVKVDYPGGAPDDEYYLYFYDTYDGPHYDNAKVINGVETEITLESDYAGGIGVNIPGAAAIADGTVEVTVITSNGLRHDVQQNTEDISSVRADINALQESSGALDIEINGDTYQRSYPIVAGEGINTTNISNRLMGLIPEGATFKLRVDYPEYTGYDSAYLYLYEEATAGSEYDGGTFKLNREITYTAPKEYAGGVGIYIPAAMATGTGTVTVTVQVESKFEQIGDRIAELEQRFSLADVLYHWMNGEKCAIGFQGDSTTDGVGTTGWTVENSHPAQDEAVGGPGARGVVDYVCELAYPRQLEKLLQSELGNPNLKVYNIGYYGASLNNNYATLTQLYSDVYSDVKMVGLTLSINDRANYDSWADYYDGVCDLLEKYVQFYLQSGITPFMVTQQVVNQNGFDPSNMAHSDMFEDNVQSIANLAKRRVADKYRLEVIDMYSFGKLVMEASSYACYDITESLHFCDLGHRLEAGYLFSELVPWVNKSGDARTIHFGFNCSQGRTDFECGRYLLATADRFKTEINQERNVTTNVCIFDAYLFNNSRDGKYRVTYLTPAASGYIVLDGDTAHPIQVTSTEMELADWDTGLHHVQVYTGNNALVAFKGFLLEQ